MTATDDKRLMGKTRWSSAARCPRMAALGLLGAEPEPPEDPERQAGRFQRGKDAQRHHYQRLLARHGDQVVTEKVVPWPAPPALPVGELHTDFFIPSEGRAEEVKSSQAGSMFDDYMTQLAGEVYFDADADHGALVYLDRDYQVSAAYPLLINEEWAERLEGIVEHVVEAGRSGELPPRICAKPSEGQSHFCPFIKQCFEGWQPTDERRDDLDALASELYLAQRALDAAKPAEDVLAPLEARVNAAKEALLEAGIREGETLCGSVAVRRTHVSDSERFSLAKFKKSGLMSEDLSAVLQPFTSFGGGHERLKAWRVSDEPLATEDFGEEAPF